MQTLTRTTDSHQVISRWNAAFAPPARPQHVELPWLAHHGQRVARIAQQTALELGMPSALAARVALAGVLHDVGKFEIPDAVLEKPGPLTSQERALMEVHPVTGAELLRGAALADVRAMVLGHHERVDGSGYPFGLAGDEIPIGGRILAVADAFDAMITDRPYRAAMSRSDACLELWQGIGSQFDGDVVDAFMATPESGSIGLRAAAA